MRRRRQLTAILDDWSDYYIERVQAVLDGTWETQSIWWGLKEGMVEMAPYGPAVTAEAAAAGDAVKRASSPARCIRSTARSRTRRARWWSPKARASLTNRC